MNGLLISLGFIVTLCYGILQIATGWNGLEMYVGSIWAAIIVIFGGFILRITLPISIGSFLFVTNIWGWHWALGLLFVVPGLLFMVPVVVTTIIASLKNKIKFRNKM